jgi:hypothetical protein
MEESVLTFYQTLNASMLFFLNIVKLLLGPVKSKTTIFKD